MVADRPFSVLVLRIDTLLSVARPIALQARSRLVEFVERPILQHGKDVARQPFVPVRVTPHLVRYVFNCPAVNFIAEKGHRGAGSAGAACAMDKNRSTVLVGDYFQGLPKLSVARSAFTSGASRNRQTTVLIPSRWTADSIWASVRYPLRYSVPGLTTSKWSQTQVS